ncbi:MAG: hypothetical protein JWP13_772 [Candidatus Saccharibacteria bacterium]|nr:hypothetical protein [Candidatus Saccharibacteria bacterium]
MSPEEYMEFSNRPDFDPHSHENITELVRQQKLMSKLGVGCFLAGLAYSKIFNEPDNPFLTHFHEFFFLSCVPMYAARLLNRPEN